MLTTKHLHLHHKATCILEMIERCDYFIQDAKNYLQTSSALAWFTYTSPQYRLQLNKYSAIKKRLAAYYADVLQRLVEPAISNAKVLGNITVHENGEVTA